MEIFQVSAPTTNAKENDRMVSVHFQSPYDYTVEVTNRFKGLDLVDREPEELWTEFHDIV